MSIDNVWVEKYRPSTVDDCILPDDLKKTFNAIADSGEMLNMLLAGSSGCGKTTVAKALCKQMGLSTLFVNASEESGIDTLRVKIRDFASTVSLSGAKKVVILDEADYLNPNSTQPALRGFIEEFSNNCRFILTCNFKNKILPAIHSRCTVIDFTLPNKIKPKLAMQFMNRCKFILDEEKIEYDDKVLAALIQKQFPDYRSILNELQKYSVGGAVDAGILSSLGEVNLNNLVGHLKKKEFTNMRKWVAQNVDNDPVRIFRSIYDSLYEKMQPASIPQAVVIIGDYSFKSAFVADQEINLVAALTELMCECEFK
jgi:DNA polymerase III delta prime subunit